MKTHRSVAISVINEGLQTFHNNSVDNLANTYSPYPRQFVFVVHSISKTVTSGYPVATSGNRLFASNLTLEQVNMQTLKIMPKHA